VPEGDSLYRFAARLHGALAGKEVLAAASHGPGPVPKVELLVGATCTGVRSQGKNALISFDNGLVLRGHLRMYGTWHIYRPGEPWSRPEREARLALTVHDAVAVNFSAPVIVLLEERALKAHAPIARLGPDLLDDAFDPAEALRRFREPAQAARTIGDALMDQRLVAGIGNIWKHETLFRCRVNPWLRVADLDDGALLALVETAQDLLRASVGKPNRLNLSRRPVMQVYMRGGQPCRRCFTRLRTEPQGEDIRHTAWCPQCQPLREGQAILPVPRRVSLPVRGGARSPSPR
jgi:endonuclease-8